MSTRSKSAFTLIELLVVIAIVLVLAGIALPIYGTIQLSAKKTQSLNNLRQLSTAALSYAGDNSGMLPPQTTTNPTWTTTGNDWYNLLPRAYANLPNLNEYASNHAAFYAKGSMFYVPAATYPADSVKLANPQFAVAFNSKLFTATINNVRLQGISIPAETVLFQECGCVGEKVINGQKAYSNQAYSFASRTAARYSGSTILTFVDGHADVLVGSTVVDPSNGKAYFAPYPSPFPTGAARIYWGLDPTASPN